MAPKKHHISDEELKLQSFGEDVFPFRDELKRDYLYAEEADEDFDLTLKADETIEYPYKSALKKKSNGKTVYQWFAVAASVAAAVLLFFYFVPNSSQPTIIESAYTQVDLPKEDKNVAEGNNDKKTQNTIKEQKKELVSPVKAEGIITVKEKQPSQEVKQNTTEREFPVEQEVIKPMDRERVVLASIDAPKQNLDINNQPKLEVEQVEVPTPSVTVTEKPKNNLFGKLLAATGIQKVTDKVEEEIVMLAKDDDGAKATLSDRIKGFNITLANNILREETIVIEEYNADGKLTKYAVNSKRFNYEKEYEE